MSNNINAVFGATNPQEPNDGVQRYASVIGLNDEYEKTYRLLHANAWEGVIHRLKASNIQNYSIYVGEIGQKMYLFSYFEYTGTDFEKDMALIAADVETQKWWLETDPCQFVLKGVREGERWKPLEQVFLLK